MENNEIERKEQADIKLDKLARNEENVVFREQCAAVKFYPLAVFTKDKRIELVAETYSVLKDIVQTVNQVLKNPGLIKVLNKRLISLGSTKGKSN